MSAVEGLTERLYRDPLVDRYVRKFRGQRPKPTSVLDYLGEHRHNALKALTGSYRASRFPQEVVPVLGAALMKSSIFIWQNDMRMLALSYNVPEHPISERSFPHEFMWWTFPGELEVEGHAGLTGVDAFLILRVKGVRDKTPDRKDGWVVYAFGNDASGPVIYLHWSAADGTSSSIEPGMLAMSAFMTSPYMSIEKKRAAENKRWKGRRIGDPTSVSVITLRSEVREAVRMEQGHGPEWKQRWMVRGHMRLQWYPSTRSHQLIWIAPYIKGPEGAPIKVPVYSVSR